MGDKLIELMDIIDQECREEGYYPDLVELTEMAMNDPRLNN